VDGAVCQRSGARGGAAVLGGAAGPAGSSLTPRRRWARIASRARAGWRPVAGCARVVGAISRAAACPSPSARRSRWPGARRDDSGDRAAAGALCVDDLARTGPQRRPRRRLRATTAHARAYERASRPKPAKLTTNQRLREIVQDAVPALLARADRRAAAPTIRRCGCLPRRSTSRSTSSRVARSSAS